jgi:hypothetical protein
MLHCTDWLLLQVDLGGSLSQQGHCGVHLHNNSKPTTASVLLYTVILLLLQVDLGGWLSQRGGLMYHPAAALGLVGALLQRLLKLPMCLSANCAALHFNVNPRI